MDVDALRALLGRDFGAFSRSPRPLDFFLICCVTGCLGVAAQPDHADLRSEKHGRVVDASTGEGLPDVAVIAKRTTTTTTNGAAGKVSSRTSCDAQQMTVTDVDGRFTLRASPEHAAATDGRRNGASSRDWSLIAFKNGYVRPGDVDILPSHPGRRFAWEESAPYESDTHVGAVDLDRIFLSKAGLEVPQQWIYDYAMLQAMSCLDAQGVASNQPDFEQLKSAMQAQLRADACAIPMEIPITPHALTSFSGVLGDNMFMRQLKAISPLATDPADGTDASAICEALRLKHSTD